MSITARLTFLILVLLSTVFLYSCNFLQHSSPTPEEQIVQELSNHRIVMLGDFAHSFPLPYHTLISTLTNWLDMLQEGRSDQRRLTLFLEDDKQTADLLKQYTKSGDPNPLLDLFLPTTSFERFEFYADLRRITLRIDSLNRVLSPDKQITFDIQGPEAMSINSPAIIDSSEKASLLYYVKDRDSLSAINIITYFKGHPEQKGLVFYGVGHLIKNVVEKGDFTGSLAPEERTGAYIGYYLKKEYGENQVFCISQIALSRLQLKLNESDDKDRMYLSPDVPWKDLPYDDENLLPENFDAFIVRHGFILQGHPLRYIFSKRIVASSLQRLRFAEPHRAGEFGERLFQEGLRTLSFLYDTTFATPDQWSAWSSTHPLNGPELLHSTSLRNRWTKEGSKLLGTPGLGNFIDNLINLGFDSRVGSPKMSREEWERDMDQMWPQIASLNAIGMYWVGDPAEQVEAKAYLSQVSGESYNDPDLYLKWWRKKFFKSDF
ncbi:MAG: hypothetical protein ACHQQQ_05635 [Bacteroidota bacterium]